MASKSSKKSSAPTVESTQAPAGEALTPLELGALQVLRQQKLDVTIEIGNLEIRKAALIRGLEAFNERGQLILSGVEARLGLQPGEQWSVGTDGKVVRVPAPLPPTE